MSSVSLEPPLVLACMANQSRMTSALTSGAGFVVHFLTGEQAGLALRFAQPLDDKFEHLSYGFTNLTEIFPRLPEYCPFTQPQRLVCTGLYHGFSYPDPVGVGFNAVPGVGELFEMPFFTFEGMKMALLFELVPGGPGEVLMHAPGPGPARKSRPGVGRS